MALRSSKVAVSLPAPLVLKFDLAELKGFVVIAREILIARAIEFTGDCAAIDESEDETAAVIGLELRIICRGHRLLKFV